jgi:glycosyltransferase involved in cell wall biosynthesis
MLDIVRGQLRAPARVIDIDVARSYGDDTLDVTGYRTAWCLVRDGGAPVAARFLDIEADSSLSMSALRDRVVASGLPTAVEPSDGFVGTMTVLIPTNRRERVPTVLASLATQSDNDFEVIVIDNSPDGEVIEALTDFEGLRVQFFHEPVPGVARARNCGLSKVTTDFVAWIDDDEIADPDWIAWLKRGFSSPGKPDAVAGVMLPAELETTAQVNFERYGGFNKGRPMEPVELRAGTPSVVDPLYPLPNFGAGGNMAFRTETLRALGGFNNRLGTRAIHGGEDTWVLAFALERGSMVLHWPLAVTWHYHRRTDVELEKQFFGYTAALTAFFTAVLFASPLYVTRLLGFVLPGLRRIAASRGSHGTDGADHLPEDFPEELRRAIRRGLLAGPWLYLREIPRQRRYPPPQKTRAVLRGR